MDRRWGRNNAVNVQCILLTDTESVGEGYLLLDPPKF